MRVQFALPPNYLDSPGALARASSTRPHQVSLVPPRAQGAWRAPVNLSSPLILPLASLLPRLYTRHRLRVLCLLFFAGSYSTNHISAMSFFALSSSASRSTCSLAAGFCSLSRQFSTSNRCTSTEGCCCGCIALPFHVFVQLLESKGDATCESRTGPQM